MFCRFPNESALSGGGRLLTAVALCLLIQAPARADALHDGIQALQDGHYEQAERLLRQAARQRPRDPQPVQWLTTLFERTMDPIELNAALTELHRRRAALPVTPTKAAKPTAVPRPTTTTRFRLDGATMPKRTDDTVDLGPLPPLPADPLTQAGSPTGPTAAAKQGRLQSLRDSLSAVQATLQQLRQRFGSAAQAPPKVQQMTRELEQKVVNHRKAMAQLQRELGE